MYKKKLCEYDLIVCHNCKKAFKDGDVIYSISKQTYYDGQFAEDVILDIEFEDFCICKILRFCEECFEEISGQEYIM